jgi:hypothetical protein
MTTGSDFLSLILGKTGDSRERVALEALVTNSSIPSFQLRFVPVHAHGKDTHGDDVVIEYLVSPDYLSVGTDDNFLRLPLMPTTAQKVADHFNCLLPTKHMVDQIYQSATIKLSPFPISPKPGDPNRDDSRNYDKSNQHIQGQLGSQRYLGLLIAGHKKDVVISNQLAQNPKKVAIYGWHQKNGQPIQPLFVGHGNFYVDYSHGIRLVSKVCRVNGVQMDLETVLQSKDYGPILTGAGPQTVTRYSF